MENDQLTKYQKAQKRVSAIRGFYDHLGAYVLVNLVLFLSRHKIRFTLISAEALGDPNILDWVDWNIFGTPIVWGIFLLFHAAKVFGWSPFFNKKWEERQLKKYLEEGE